MHQRETQPHETVKIALYNVQDKPGTFNNDIFSLEREKELKCALFER